MNVFAVYKVVVLNLYEYNVNLLGFSYAYIELKDGRVPEGITKRMGYWKAEEFQKFTFPASEYVLDGILPDEHFNVWQLIVRITELVFSCGRNGLTTGLL